MFHKFSSFYICIGYTFNIPACIYPFYPLR